MTADGFNLEVRPACGGIYNVTNKSPKTINFKNVNDGYSAAGSFCNYTFVTNTEHTIVVRFQPQRSFIRDSCDTSKYVNVYKWNRYSKEMGLDDKFCIKSLDKQFSAQNQMLLEFNMKEVNTYTFKFEYYLESCRDVIKTPGWIFSPKGKADIIDECAWTIEAPQNHQIKLSFEKFHVGRTYTCRYSSFGVQVYTGNDTETSYKICGRFNETKVIKIPASTGTIKYYSPSSDETDGFKVKVEFIKMCDEVIDLNASETFQLLKELGNGTDNYECNYYLSAPEGFRIEAELRDLKMLLGDGKCNETFIELYEGYDVHEGLIQKLCKNEPVKMISPENQLNILAKGRTLDFKIAVNLKATWCGSNTVIILNEEKAEGIQMPKYPPNTYCKWTIKSDSYFDIVVDYLDLQQRSDVTGECLDQLSINSFTVSFFF